MERSMLMGTILISIGLFMTAGCSSYDVVRKDEAISATAVIQKDVSKQNVQDKTVKTAEPVVEQKKENQNVARAAQLQSALEKILFDFDSYALSESARTTLTKNAELLLKADTAKISIVGNCDERGSAEYNLALGERRARTAKQYLTTLGVSGDRLSTLSYGKEHPVNQGHGESAWKNNRRDDFFVAAY